MGALLFAGQLLLKCALLELVVAGKGEELGEATLELGLDLQAREGDEVLHTGVVRGQRRFFTVPKVEGLRLLRLEQPLPIVFNGRDRDGRPSKLGQSHDKDHE